MRESKSKSRGGQTSNGDVESPSFLLEMEMSALRVKNADLTQTVTKLRQENADLRNKLYTLQAENMDINLETNSLSRTLDTISETTKSCMPHLLEFINVILKVTDNNWLKKTSKVQSAVPATPPKTVTQTVKPHTVNGTVLNLMPTISLTRLNNGPSTSREAEREADVDDSPVDEQEASFVNRTRPRNSMNTDPTLNDWLELEHDAQENESDSPDEQEEQEVSRLTPIVEESTLDVSDRLRSTVSEVRIYLSRLTNDTSKRDEAGTSFRDSTCSIEPQVNDTHLNMETTEIETHEESKTSRLRVGAAATTFSPRSNSTRIEFDDDSPVSLKKKSPRIAITPILEPNEGAIGDVLFQNVNQISRIPTPSTSAMGDMTRIEESKLNLFNRLGLSPTPTSDLTGDSPRATITSAVSPKRSPNFRTRSSFKIRQATLSTNDSPRSSHGSLVTRTRGGSRITLSPIVILEKLENTVEIMKCSNGASSSSYKNENEENETKLKKRKRTRTKSATRKDENEQQVKLRKSLEQKIEEVKKRLSSSSSVNSNDSESPIRKRPTRAARPKVLKDASLKKKLRRS